MKPGPLEGWACRHLEFLGAKERQQIPARRWILLLIVVTLVAYANSLNGEFLYDDLNDVLSNPTIGKLWPPWATGWTFVHGKLVMLSRPVVNLSFAINHALGGLHPPHYHITNLIIHVLAGLTLLGILRRTLSLPALRKRFQGYIPELSFFIAALWALHPIQTESVSYVTQRYESMMGLFSFGTLYCVIRSAGSPLPSCWAALASISGFLALESKEVAVSLPLLVLLFDRAFLAGSFKEALRCRRMLYLGLATALAGFAFCQTHVSDREWAGFGLAIPWWRYALSQPGVILHYLRLVVWPHPLCLDYGWPVASAWRQILPESVIVGAMLMGTLYGLVKRPMLGFLGAAFFLILAPTSSLMPILDLAVEHRMYVPLAPVLAILVLGLFLALKPMIGTTAIRSPLWCGIFVITAMSILATLGTMTFHRNRAYAEPLTIWQDTVAKAANNPRAHLNFGHALQQAGRAEEALVEYQLAIRLAPRSPMAYNNLGVLYEKLNRIPESLECLKKALEIAPNDPKVLSNLGVSLIKQGSCTEAITCFQKALRIDPKLADAHNNLGEAYVQTGRIEAAVEQYREAIALRPDSFIMRWNLGMAFWRSGRKDEAMTQFSEGVLLEPDRVDASYRLGWFLYQKHLDPEAMLLWRRTLQLEPGHPQTMIHLAWLLATSPDATVRNGIEALSMANAIIQISGTRSSEGLDLLAAALAEVGQFDQACRIAQEALDKSAPKDEAWRRKLRLRLTCYQAGQAYRETERK